MSIEDEFAGHPAVSRVVRIGQRLRRLDTDHPWLLDAGVVVFVVLAFCLPQLFGHERRGEHEPVFWSAPAPLQIALQAGLVLPLLWRRRYPTVTFYVIAATFIVQWSLGIALRADIALLIAGYNMVLHARPNRLTWAGLTAIGAMTLVAVRVSGTVALGDAMFLALSTLTAAAALGIAVRLRRAQLQTLRERAAQLELERDQRSRLAAVTERNRIAREMHDVLGHNLSVIISLADGGAAASTVRPQRGTQALDLIGDVGRRALGDLRRVLGILRDDDDAAERAPQPGIAAIATLCDQTRAAGPQIHYRTEGVLESLDPGVQLAAYRIVQEALTNSLRYAGPRTRIDLALRVDERTLTIDVHDTGVPDRPQPGPGEPHAGQGLIGMRERAAVYRGTVDARPDPRGGWTVAAVLHLPDHEKTGTQPS
ncbi:sensor histidine kinase [Hamadaea tsunoensis]|uniref:sensor histidine kinase n=1 Tax=Hamadaea tsunoensis TaxID=53368 RepID=UPI0003F6C8FB|nr:histidine kinase [Hamadaea tsunoensis]